MARLGPTGEAARLFLLHPELQDDDRHQALFETVEDRVRKAESVLGEEARDD